MSAALDALQGKVQRMLTSAFGPVQVDADGDFSLLNDSARLFAHCSEFGEDTTTVELFCPMLFEVPESIELFRHIATANSYRFGTLHAVQEGEGTYRIVFKHTLLGDYLDEEELKNAVIMLLGTANDLDDSLQQEFGGRRFHEEE